MVLLHRVASTRMSHSFALPAFHRVPAAGCFRRFPAQPVPVSHFLMAASVERVEHVIVGVGAARVIVVQHIAQAHATARRAGCRGRRGSCAALRSLQLWVRRAVGRGRVARFICVRHLRRGATVMRWWVVRWSGRMCLVSRCDTSGRDGS